MWTPGLGRVAVSGVRDTTAAGYCSAHLPVGLALQTGEPVPSGAGEQWRAAFGLAGQCVRSSRRYLRQVSVVPGSGSPCALGQLGSDEGGDARRELVELPCRRALGSRRLGG